MPQSLAEQLKAIPMSSTLRETLDRARGFARAQSHRAVLLEHLLLALIEDPDASGVLRASHVDTDQLGTEASGYLGLRDDVRAEPGHEPQPDPELQRVLHAAGQAAQQSRRRQIDGAIVLAAIVGDGKSPAAGMLKTLGLGFEEAIRALQKASAQARSKQFAPPPAGARQPSVTAPAPEPAPPAPVEPPPPAMPEPFAQAEAEPAQPTEPPQTVEEILAAARARIQRRTSGIVGKPAAPVPMPAPTPAPERQELPLPAPTPADEPEADLTIPDPPTPQTELQRAPGGTSWTPPPAARPETAPTARAAPDLNKPPLSFPPRPFPPREAPPDSMRPPLPSRSGPQLRPQPGLPPGAPWPPAGRAPMPQRPPANGAGGGQAPPPSAPKPASSRQGSAGPLIETIPRRMRVGVPAPAQVRINRDKIDALVLLLLGRREGPQRQNAFLMRALTVRLVAPDGGFWIETGAPETQWIDASNASLQQDDHASWRWSVVPQARGRHRLLLSVSMRTVGHDGVAAETAPPDRVIDVAVKGSAGQGLLRWLKVAALLIAGALVGRFGFELWAMGATALRRFL